MCEMSFVKSTAPASCNEPVPKKLLCDNLNVIQLGLSENLDATLVLFCILEKYSVLTSLLELLL